MEPRIFTAVLQQQVRDATEIPAAGESSKVMSSKKQPQLSQEYKKTKIHPPKPSARLQIRVGGWGGQCMLPPSCWAPRTSSWARCHHHCSRGKNSFWPLVTLRQSLSNCINDVVYSWRTVSITQHHHPSQASREKLFFGGLFLENMKKKTELADDTTVI